MTPSLNCFRAIVSILLVSSVAGCATTDVKTMTADEYGYAQKNFGQQMLSPKIRSALPQNGSGRLQFRKLTVSGTRSFRASAEAESQTSTYTDIFINDGNSGILQSIGHLYKNGLPVSIEYETTYLGLLNLRWQFALTSRENASSTYEIKEFRQLSHSLDNPLENTQYNLAYNAGSTEALLNFAGSSVAISCKTDKFYDAMLVSPGLTGRALDLNCETVNSETGLASGKNSFTYLSEYGIYVARESTSTRGIAHSHIDSIKIE